MNKINIHVPSDGSTKVTFVGYDWNRADRALWDRFDGESYLALIEVFEASGLDLSRPGRSFDGLLSSVDWVGALFLVDEAGLDWVDAQSWHYSVLDSLGLLAEELA